MQNEYKFLARTQNGALIKPVLETYIGLTNSIILFINKFGIYTYILNASKQILMQTTFPADKFEKFVCNESQISITMIADELYTHLKSIKKKNVLTFFIENDNPNQFGVAIDIHGEQMNSNISKVRILEVYDSVSINSEFDYKHMYKISSKEFQRAVKEILKLDDTITIYGYKSFMGLKVIQEGVDIKECRFNILDNRNPDSNEEKKGAYVRQVETKLLNDISKVLPIHKCITVCLTEGLPIKIELDTGSIVKADIYIKTTDMAVPE